jgi:membrane-bound lytic murein transglycosylase D
MKSFLLLVVLGVVFGFWNCQTLGIKKGPQPVSNEDVEKSPLQSTLDEIDQLVGFANKAKTIHDTLGADFYYQQALRQADSLYAKNESDSMIALKKKEISDSYNLFLEEFSFAAADTVSDEDVIEELSIINESFDSTGSDTSTISITDVIDEAHQMKIPLVLNKKVEKAIEYFTSGKGRKVFTIWLQRAGKYEKLIKKILREEGVPEELFYLAMIESGFRPEARSWAKAVGIWQFIYGTGRMYDLKASWWFDERRDPVKSTRAAASHLKNLYSRFGDWYLAMAGYNYSPGKIEKRLSKYGVSDYWDLPRLPRETRNYVPTFIAAATIAQDREKYEFDIEHDPPLEIDTVTVRECVDLNVVADCVSSSFAEIKSINPALLRWCTPPDQGKWVLNLPKGSREIFVKNYAKIPDNQKTSWVRHYIRSGETLSGISSRYGVSINEIKRFNRIRGTMIRAGGSLVIPVPQNKNYYKSYANYSNTSRTSAPRKVVEDVPGREKRVYLVKNGDTLWDIANLFGATVSQIRSWNGLGGTRIIHPNQKLNVWILPGNNVIDENTLAAKTEPASEPKIDSQPSTRTTSTEYTVRQGDTLWGISQSFGVSIGDIKKWNGKRSNMIKPGEKLTIMVQD